MDRFRVLVTVRAAPSCAPVLVTPGLLARLSLDEDQAYVLRFGSRRAEARFRAARDLEAGEVSLPHRLAESLCVEGPIRTTIFRTAGGGVALGPLVGVLVSRARLTRMLEGELKRVIPRYARHAAEVGAILVFFAVGDLDPAGRTIQGYQLVRNPGGFEWLVHRLPVPRVVYDRCMGRSSRLQSARLRRLARKLGFIVVNRPIKISKLGAFKLLRRYPELAPHLPFVAPLTRESLCAAMMAYDDLYLKPNALGKGVGVYRLSRRADGWLLQGREKGRVANWVVADPESVEKVMARNRKPRRAYLLQEGLPLAAYLGNRFDFRSLVQKDGRGQWTLTGLVARIAPQGSPISSPRSGGQVAPAERVLRHAFPDRWPAVLAELERVSYELARRIETHLGPCSELGLDLGVTQDGAVKLIEVNGKPLKVSLARLRDPLFSERMYRYPIHYAAYLDLLGADERCSG